MNEHEFRQLVERYITDELSPTAQQQFFEYLDNEYYRKLLEEILESDWKEGRYEHEEMTKIYEKIEQHVFVAINQAPVRAIGLRTWPRQSRIAAAIAFLVLISAAGFFIYQSKLNEVSKQISSIKPAPVTILPGSNGAILTLDDGKEIVLDNFGNGLVAKQGSSAIVKQSNGLSYEQSGKINGDDVLVYNTVSTPRGRQYPNLTLSDGTNVWLDAGSSIRFPVVFSASERRVEITGQVWFDVEHDERKPFRVLAKGVEIRDLGTQFNVKAYEDEPQMTITLLQGVVEVQQTRLKPGEQAKIMKEGALSVEKQVDLEEVTAWKDGYFKFDHADVITVLRALSRWYDVDVAFAGSIPKQTFTGKIGRNLTLQDVLDGLAFTNNKFRIEGRKIIIQP